MRSYTLSRTLEERFWEKVDKKGEDECWPWTAAKNHAGYGVIGIGAKKLHTATHISLMFDGRPRPGRLKALHKCDNPPCVNPKHLWWGTDAENLRDMREKGRDSKVRALGSCHGCSKLSEAQVLEIRASPLSLSKMARQYNITKTTVSRIRLRKAWRHI